MKIERPISFSPYGSPYRKPPDIFECSLWNTVGSAIFRGSFPSPSMGKTGFRWFWGVSSCCTNRRSTRKSDGRRRFIRRSALIPLGVQREALPNVNDAAFAQSCGRRQQCAGHRSKKSELLSAIATAAASLHELALSDHRRKHHFSRYFRLPNCLNYARWQEVVASARCHI